MRYPVSPGPKPFAWPASATIAQAPPRALQPIGNRPFIVDASTMVAISVAICLASQHLVLMNVLVPTLLALRFWAWSRTCRAERDLAVAGEMAFFSLCIVLGAFNDWNSVSRQRVYDYNVPVENAALSLIPVWMLLYWGMILRFVSSLFRWQLLKLPPPKTTLHLGGRSLHLPTLRLALLGALVLLTRQLIYRHFAHPLWSWLPFAVAICLVLLVLRPDKRRLALLAAFGVIGPAVEILYIHVGNLHVYQLGWLGGVPLWIALWWILAAFVWDEFSSLIIMRFQPMGAPLP